MAAICDCIDSVVGGGFEPLSAGLFMQPAIIDTIATTTSAPQHVKARFKVLLVMSCSSFVPGPGRSSIVGC